MEALNGFAASIGLGSLGPLGSLLVGIILVFIIVQLFTLPFRLVWNGICGAVLLWLVNFLGAMVDFHMHITIFKALIAGFFGIPGVIAVILFEIFA